MPFSNNDDDIVTLTNDKGEEIDFVEIAGINLKGKFYAILQPVELLPGMSDDEALVFQVTRVGGEDKFNIEMDDKIIDQVFKEYNRMLDEASGSGKKKLKKSSGAGKVFGATTKVVKKTFWLIGMIIYIALALAGLGFAIGGAVTISDDIIMGIVFLVIGVALLSLGVRGISKKWKNRNK